MIKFLLCLLGYHEYGKYYGFAKSEEADEVKIIYISYIIRWCKNCNRSSSFYPYGDIMGKIDQKYAEDQAKKIAEQLNK